MVGLALAGLVAWGLLAAKRASGALNYYVSKVALSFEGVTPVLRLDITTQNPSNHSFIIKSIAGDLLVDGQKVGNASVFQTITIPETSVQIIPVYVRLSPLAVVSDLVRIITQGSGIPKEISFKGFINVNDIVADLDLTYKIPG